MWLKWCMHTCSGSYNNTEAERAGITADRQTARENDDR